MRATRLASIWWVCLWAPWVTASLHAQSEAFQRGDTDGDGTVGLTDAVYALNYLFLGSQRPACLKASDVNDDGAVDIADATHALGYLFLGGPSIAAPFPECGVDPTPDALGCESSSQCEPFQLFAAVGEDPPGACAIEDELFQTAEGGCKDLSTGLVWSSLQTTLMTWDQADANCASLTEDGFTDWRLPTIEELQDLILVKDSSHLDFSQRPGSGALWSSKARGIFAWAVLRADHPTLGDKGDAIKTIKESYIPHFCVRDGTPPPPSFCGDGVCDPDEDPCDCPEDCGAPPPSETACDDGEDDDCDGLVDCADPDCDADPACQGPDCGNGVCEPGEDCDTCPNDCDGKSNGPPSGRFCCGNGVTEDPELADPSLCDGND